MMRNSLEDNVRRIQEMRENPEITASIREGLHDCHLGHMFSHKQVFGALEGTGGIFLSRWFYRLIINSKRLWWWVKAPWQKFVTHRNCPDCINYGQQT